MRKKVLILFALFLVSGCSSAAVQKDESALVKDLKTACADVQTVEGVIGDGKQFSQDLALAPPSVRQVVMVGVDVLAVVQKVCTYVK